ncbi:MAG: phosphatidate cytidylyltransferase [bacterium]|nr:phosphatidate cytidylyltransferase [bacterium]
MNSLHKRLLTAFAGIPLLLYLANEGNWFFFSLTVFISLVSAGELMTACRDRGLRFNAAVTLSGVTVALLVSKLCAGGQIPLPLLVPVLLWLVFSVAGVLRADMSIIQRISVTIITVIYLGILPAHLVLLRDLAGSLQFLGREWDKGFFIIIWLYLVVWGTDTGAYAVGTLIGRRRIFPVVSPNKSLEGLLGGLSLALLLGMTSGSVLFHDWPKLAVSVLATSLAAVYGDLFASLLKRALSIKDFGGVLPGHGGILDRFDSLIMAAPTAYICIRLFFS